MPILLCFSGTNFLPLAGSKVCEVRYEYMYTESNAATRKFDKLSWNREAEGLLCYIQALREFGNGGMRHKRNYIMERRILFR